MRINTTVGANVNELEIFKQRCRQYEQQIEELKNNYERRLMEYKNKYLVLEEQYNLLIYKRFVRSAEQILADEKQQMLFTEEAQEVETKDEEPQELETVKSFTRKKAGRKAIKANISPHGACGTGNDT